MTTQDFDAIASTLVGADAAIIAEALENAATTAASAVIERMMLVSVADQRKMDADMSGRPALQWFHRADREFLERVQHVMLASTSPDPMNMAAVTLTTPCNYRPIHMPLVLLRSAAEERHAAKHAALIESHYALPTTVTLPRP